MKWKLSLVVGLICLALFPNVLVRANDQQDKLLFEAGKCFNKGDYESAIEYSTQAIEIEENEKAYYSRGVAYKGKKEYDRALEDFTTAVALEPSNYNAYESRALILVQIKLYDQALIDCNKVIELRAGYSSAYINRGDVYLLMGRSNDALADYTSSINRCPLNDLAYIKRGNIYGLLGRYDEAICDYQRSLKSFPYQIAMFGIGQAMELKGNKAAAMQCYQEAESGLPEKLKIKAVARMNGDWIRYSNWISYGGP